MIFEVSFLFALILLRVVLLELFLPRSVFLSRQSKYGKTAHCSTNNSIFESKKFSSCDIQAKTKRRVVGK